MKTNDLTRKCDYWQIQLVAKNCQFPFLFRIVFEQERIHSQGTYSVTLNQFNINGYHTVILTLLLHSLLKSLSRRVNQPITIEYDGFPKVSKPAKH
jgi:hypothetical protein